MNSKLTFCATCCATFLLTASFAVGAPRGGGGGRSGSMRGGHTFTRGGSGTYSGRQWSGTSGTYRNWSRTSGTYRNWSGSNWSGDWRRHHRRFSNDVIFIGDFGFPYWGWGYPYGYYDYGYPYDYYGYGYGYDDYGYDYDQPGYGYGYGNRSTVAAVQRRLAQAGYYHGAIDGIMGPRTRRAIRAYERSHNQREYGMNDR